MALSHDALSSMIDTKLKSTLQDATRKLTGAKKRAFMAKATQDYFHCSARQAETHVGWNRHSVQLGLLQPLAVRRV